MSSRRVPGRLARVLGVRNLRGDVLPVFDLAAVFGHRARRRRTMVVAERSGARAGLPSTR